MKILKKHIETFNQPDSLLVVSSFPQKGREIAKEGGLARYVYLLLKNFPKDQKVVVFSDRKSAKTGNSYLLQENVLVVPTYTKNSLRLFLELQRSLSKFSLAKNLLIQFEFTSFGNKTAIPGVCLTLLFEKMKGKHITVSLHQVVKGLSSLSGHLGTKKGSLLTHVLNILLAVFYRFVGLVSDKIIVHDMLLGTRLLGLVSNQKVEVIPHGIGKTKKFSKAFEAKSRKHFGFTKSEKVVTLFGYHSWYKGTDWIVKVVGEIAKENPGKRIKLFLAGDKSPTLKDTKAYKSYSEKLEKLIDKHKEVVVVSGFVPEKDVEKVYATSDVMVFPYRTKMSASGPIALAWQYQKPYLFSSKLKSGLVNDFENKVNKDAVFFNMNKKDFQDKLFFALSRAPFRRQLSEAGEGLAKQRSWRNVAVEYKNVSFKPKEIRVTYEALATK